jgi:hypothetical protein
VNRRETSKDIPVGDKKFKLTKMDPRSACWLFTNLADKTESGSLLISALGKCSREEFNEIQDLALKHVFFLDEKDGNVFPTVLVSSTGVWVDKDLESDPRAVFQLTTESIMFNISPFLTESK